MAKIAIHPGLDLKLSGKKKKLPIIRAYYRPFFFAALPANILSLTLVVVFFKFLPPVIPLLGSVLDRQERLVDKIWIFTLCKSFMKETLIILVLTCLAMLKYSLQ